MTQPPATPELVERLRSPEWGEFRSVSSHVLCQEAADALEAQQARIAELEGENEQLRLAICGGEDAPGYASSLPLETILKVCADNHATARRDGQMAWNGDTATSWRSCAEEAQALADRYEKALREIADMCDRAVIEQTSGKYSHDIAPAMFKQIWQQIRQALSSQGRREGEQDSSSRSHGGSNA